MAANKGGDTKQGLIIALVCFIVLSLGLGIAAYYGYADNAGDRAKAKEAEAKATSMAKNREWYKYLYLQLRAYAGHQNPADANDLANLSGQNLSGEQKETADVQKLFETLKANLIKEKGKDATAEYYADKVARLEKELQDTKKHFADTDLELKKANASIAQKNADMEAEGTDWKKKLDAANALNLKERSDLEANFQKMLAEFGDLNKKINDLTKKADEDGVIYQRKIKLVQGQKNQVELEINKLRDQLKPLDILKFDTPKAAIVRLDAKGDVAWINIGSADNLKASQSVTFSIFAASTAGKIGGERKGALEVVDVVGPHLALAKITQVTDPNRDPIVNGDLLINPAWSPTNRTHVAIAGLIDMTGEGRDQVDEFMRSLKHEGMDVDAYLDLRDLAIKGGGMTLKTDYLIIGEAPDIAPNLNVPSKKDDVRYERKTAIAEKIAEMTKQATELGVTIVPLRRFAMLTGYRLPKGVGVGRGAGYDFIRPSETLSAPEKQPAKKNGKAEAKPEKKDKDDEDR